MSSKPANVDEYLAGVPPDHRETLEGVRASIRALVPEVVESIGYGIPAYKYGGKVLVYFGDAKEHCALYGLDTALAEQAGYETSQKGTIRFAPGAPPPDALLKSWLDARIAAIEAAGSKRKQSGQARRV